MLVFPKGAGCANIAVERLSDRNGVDDVQIVSSPKERQVRMSRRLLGKIPCGGAVFSAFSDQQHAGRDHHEFKHHHKEALAQTIQQTLAQP